MSYPIADVDRFAEYETNPLPVRVRGAELTVGAISRGMKGYAQAFDLLRGELLSKRSGFANEYDLWCWLGAQLLELERDPQKSRVVLAYWRSLYPKQQRVAATPRDALDGRIVAIDLDSCDLPAIENARRLAFEVVYSKPMLSVAMFALEHVRKDEVVPSVLSRVPRDLYLKLAMQARPKKDPALAVRIVAHLFVEELEITRAVEHDLAELVRPAARRKLSERDAGRFAKIVARLPSAWSLGSVCAIEIVRAFQSAADAAACTMSRALELVERIGRHVAPRLGTRDWPLASAVCGPRATQAELGALVSWIRNVRNQTQSLALLRSVCSEEVKL